MEIKQLKYFVYVAELMSFSKAANHLSVEQPAVSKAVQALERHLNCRLFVRTSRSVVLTQAGQILLPRAHSILRQIEQTELQIAAHGRDLTGTVTIGIPPIVGTVLIPAVVRKLTVNHPGIFVDLVESVGAGLYERLLNQDISAAFIHEPVPHKELDIQPMFVEEMYLVGPPVGGSTGLLAANEVEDLDNLPMILPDRRHMRRLLAERFFSERGLRLNIKMQADGVVMLRSLINAGLGYSVLSKGSILNEISSGSLSARPLSNAPVLWTLSLVTRSSYRRDAVFEKVINAFREEVSIYIQKNIYIAPNN